MIVDRGAKEGAARHPQHDEVIALARQANAIVHETALFLDRVAENRWEKHKVILKAASKRAAAQSSEVSQPAEKKRKTIRMQHRVCLEPAMRWRCGICLVTADIAAFMTKVECVETTVGSPLQRHDLWQATYFRGHFVYCRLCGL